MPAKKTTPDAKSPSATPSFEDSLDELQQIVSQLEAGSLSLEDSMAQFERGVGLLRNCYQVLETAEQRIEILTQAHPERAVTEPFDASATLEQDTAAQHQPTRRQPPRPAAGQLFGE